MTANATIDVSNVESFIECFPPCRMFRLDNKKLLYKPTIKKVKNFLFLTGFSYLKSPWTTTNLRMENGT